MKLQMYYNIQTRSNGWYYTTGNGKYGHTSSLRLMADAFCRQHWILCAKLAGVMRRRTDNEH